MYRGLAVEPMLRTKSGTVVQALLAFLKPAQPRPPLSRTWRLTRVFQQYLLRGRVRS